MINQNRHGWQNFVVASNPTKLTAVIGLCVVSISVGLTWGLGSLFIPPEKMLRSFALAVMIPALIAPPIVWVLLDLLRQLRAAEHQQRELVKELTKRVSEVKTLRGLLPICAECKNFRDDSGFWHEVESFLTQHTEAEFSHSFCPDCLHKLYPDFAHEIVAKIDSRQDQDTPNSDVQP